MNAEDDFAFKISCMYNHKEIIEWLINVGKFDNKLINEKSEHYDSKLVKQIFDKGYKPLNNQIKEYYKEYDKRKREIKENTKKYIVPELADLVYDYE